MPRKKSVNTDAIPRKKLTVKIVATLLRKHNGNLSLVAKACRVTRQSVWCYLEAYPILKRICGECRESLKDFAEGKLQAAFRKGEGWAIKYYLSTQAKDRGYIERSQQEVTGRDGEPLPSAVTIIRIPSNGRDLPDATDTGTPILTDRPHVNGTNGTGH